MIEDIIREHRRSSDPVIHVGESNPFIGNTERLKIPDKYVGLIIGKSGENLKGIAQRSNTRIFVPQRNSVPEADERLCEIVGDPNCVEMARQEIHMLIQKVINHSSYISIQYLSSNVSGSGTYDFNKNPYGSGIAVYNQTKLGSDGHSINGAVPENLR